MNWLEYWYAFPVAIFTATLAMSSGFGGGLIFAPFFMLVLKLSPEQALGTALLTEVFGMGTGFMNYYRMRLIDFYIGKKLILGSVPGALLGSIMINYHFISEQYLKLLFGLAITTLAFTLIIYRKCGAKDQDTIPDCRLKNSRAPGSDMEKYFLPGRKKVKMVLLSFLAGMGVGTIAIGSGEINTPQLISTGISPRVAIPTSVFVMIVTVISATSIYVLKGQPVPELALYTCSGVIFGAKLGTSLIVRIREELLRWWLFLLFLLIGITILVTTFL